MILKNFTSSKMGEHVGLQVLGNRAKPMFLGALQAP